MTRKMAVRAALHGYSSALVVMPKQRSAATVIEEMSIVVIAHYQHVKRPDRPPQSATNKAQRGD